MRKAFEKYINECQLFEQEDKILVAVSGGADSVALCYLLHYFKINFIIAHCNFKLRGKESDEDEKFVIQLAAKLNVEIFVKNFNTSEEAKNNSKSIQMIARELRYQWFNQLRVEQRCKYIATAHHKNDALETILLNITRGTGIAGLHGIKPKVNSIVRPLSFATKSQIIEWVNSENISFREDSSNSINKYHRNLIRNRVVPQLKSINPNLEETISAFIAKIRCAEEILTSEIEKFKSGRLTTKGEYIYLNINNLKEEAGLEAKLFGVLEEYNYSSSQCKSIINCLEKQSGKMFLSSTHQLIKDRNELIISASPKQSDDFFLIQKGIEEINLTYFSLVLKCKCNEEFEIIDNKRIAQLDFDKITFPLTLRHWQKGDYFVPLGMSNKKKLSDFFIDRKISVLEKNKKFVLTSQEKIIWIVGERIDDRFKITPDTRNVLVIELI